MRMFKTEQSHVSFLRHGREPFKKGVFSAVSIISKGRGQVPGVPVLLRTAGCPRGRVRELVWGRALLLHPARGCRSTGPTLPTNYRRCCRSVEAHRFIRAPGSLVVQPQPSRVGEGLGYKSREAGLPLAAARTGGRRVRGQREAFSEGARSLHRSDPGPTAFPHDSGTVCTPPTDAVRDAQNSAFYVFLTAIKNLRKNKVRAQPGSSHRGHPCPHPGRTEPTSPSSCGLTA